MIINDTLMSPSSSPLMDSIREHHTSKSSDEEITEDENGDENEEDEEEADDEDREITDDSNDVNRIERIPILNEENASDAPSPVKRPRACASWYPNAGTVRIFFSFFYHTLHEWVRLVLTVIKWDPV